MAERIVGYQRVLDADACAFCQEVEGAFVYSDDPMPLHDGCGCSVEPVTEEVRARQRSATRARPGAPARIPAVLREPTRAGVLDSERTMGELIRFDPARIEVLDPDDAASARFFGDRGTIGLQFSSSADSTANAVVHEYGHRIDRLALGDDTDTYFSESDAGDELWQMLRHSPTMEAVRSDAIEILRGDIKTRNYFLQGREMFARAFHQYIATRGNNPALRRELDSIRGTEYLRFQFWPDDEFEPIARKLDEIFREAGIAL